MRSERDAAKQQAAEASSRAADIEEELRLTEELYKADKSPTPARGQRSYEDDHDPGTPTRSTTLAPAAGNDVTLLKAAHERELHARDAEIRSLRSRLSTSPPLDATPSRAKRDSTASSASKRSITGSPLLGGKDEAAIVKDQLAGLKVLISQMTEENRELAEVNDRLKRDLQNLRCVCSC